MLTKFKYRLQVTLCEREKRTMLSPNARSEQKWLFYRKWNLANALRWMNEFAKLMKSLIHSWNGYPSLSSLHVSVYSRNHYDSIFRDWKYCNSETTLITNFLLQQVDVVFLYRSCSHCANRNKKKKNKRNIFSGLETISITTYAIASAIFTAKETVVCRFAIERLIQFIAALLIHLWDGDSRIKRSFCFQQRCRNQLRMQIGPEQMEQSVFPPIEIDETEMLMPRNT